MGVKRRKQASPRYEHVCRNGHVRTDANTHRRSDGGRQCMDCPGFQRKRLSTKQRRLLDAGLRGLPGAMPELAPAQAPGPKYYRRLLSDEELAYLRSLIPCAGCGAAFGTAHRWDCEVPFNVEHDGTAEPSQKSTRAA